MDKQSIRNILSIKHYETKIRTLDRINTTKRETKDSVNEKVWWVIRKGDLEKLKKFWLWENLSKEVKRECKIIWLKLIKVLSSVSTWQIKNSIQQKLWNCWVALEFFLLDKLIRKNKKNDEISFEKWPLEFDNEKIDFLSSYQLENDRIIIWNQLTTTESKRINNKDNEVRWVWDRLDNQKWKINENNFSITQIPDLPILFVINSKTSREVNKWIGSRTNILKEAYLKWKDEGFKEWWPSLYLEEDIQRELDLISISYTEIIKEFIRFIKEENLEKPWNYISKSNWVWIVHIKYDSENMEYEASFFEKTKRWEDFIFSLKFYITNKFLKKIWIKKETHRERESKKIKKVKKNQRRRGNRWYIKNNWINWKYWKH